ncbi:MAG: AAA family ATPase [Bacteroidota bacterium]
MSYLKINQLLVTKGGKEVYNQKFHTGINIIRGHNSSGKSTISNFIFYVLGGEFTSWLPEAASCDFVIAEININGRIITIKRDISDKVKRPMSIYFGNLEESSKSLFDGWVIHPYVKSAKAETFSQVLFKFLEFPDISTDNQESITINQTLRLMYIDQLSSLDSLMRNEDFDSPTIRQSIGYLLLGTYDDELLQMQMSLKDKRKQLSEIDKQIDAIEDVFKNSQFEFNSEKILQQKQKNDTALANVLKQLSEPLELKNTNHETQKQLNNLRELLLRKKKEYALVAERVDKVSLDTIDSNDFIITLEEKIDAINQSISARNSFRDIAISHCPACLEKLDENEDEKICHLCKSPKTIEPTNSKILRMKLELEMQLKESKSLLEYKNLIIRESKDELEQIKRDLKVAQTNYDIFISQSRSTTESFYDKLLEKKGNLIASNEFLDRELALYDSYAEYRIQKESLTGQISNLSDKVETLQEHQQNKAKMAFDKIQKYTIELLQGDGNYETHFKNAQNLKVSFSKNTFFLDGRNRFSASSMVLLKNCVRFAIFFASIELDFLRYPKFILCDNIEDKGMEESRSKNFQKNIVKIAESDQFKGKDFQMIFSTSMINSDLDIEKYTIGEFYDENNKTLKLGVV